MTLMPVSRISLAGSDLIDGGSRPVNGVPLLGLDRLLAVDVLPRTLKSRPRTSGPTGTVMGAPVSERCWPRCSPSVEAMATHRTVLFPRCCCTSRTSSG